MADDVFQTGGQPDETSDDTQVAARPGFIRRVGLVEFLLYFAVAIAATWPLARHGSSALPMGVEPVPTVHLLQAWAVWWNADRLQHGFQDYWNAPMYYPASDAFAFSEPQPTTAVVAPLVWMSDSPALAYNAYVWLSFALNGFAAFHLLRRFGLTWTIALCGGAMVEMLPMMHWRLGLVQLIGLYGTIWTIHSLYNYGEQPSVRRGLLVGVAFSVAYLVCNYFGLFLATALLVTGWWLLGRSALNWRTYAKLVPGGCLCLAALLPIVSKQLSVSKAYGWEPREESTLLVLSSDLSDFIQTPWPQQYGLPDLFVSTDEAEWRRLGPGILKMLLALLGVAWCVCQASLRRWGWFCVSLSVFALLMSMGLKLHVGDAQPFRWVMAHVPGYSHTRSIFRFAYLVQLSTGLMAAFGLHAVWVGAKRCRLRWIPTFAVLVLGFVAATEVWPASQKLYALPQAAQRPLWVEWIGSHTREGTPVACVPFSRGKTVFHNLRETQWVYWSMYHRRPILNGYSSQMTPEYRELKAAMASFPDVRSLKLLHQLGARYCVVQRIVADSQTIASNPICRGVLVHEFSDDTGNVDVYRIVSPPSRSIEAPNVGLANASM
ncbi:MAG: hypothetical protein O3A00_12220 [Planctomycetota bacterium]|nr:hypothetical protein [Planctomycetota bacterium]